MATYAIGDIQGCYDELQALLKLVKFSDEDHLWVAGDLVNRGPKSLETLRFLKSLGTRATCVLGNHDLHLLAISFGATTQKRSDTLAPIFSAHDKEELFAWLLQQKLMVHNKEHNVAMVHAGIPPCWSIRKARKRAKEVERILNSALAKEYFNHMYGNTPDTWSPQLEGWDRLRLITNYLTRMRFCTPEGTLDFSAKGTLESQPEGYKPWFKFPRKKTKEQATRILFGHWAALEGKADAHNVFALDTGCVWGGQLTAMRLDDMQLFSTNAIDTKKTPPPTSHYL